MKLHAMALHWAAVCDLGRRYGAVFRASWAQRGEFDERRWNADEAEFLPAALSLQETPPSPAPRVTAWLLMTFALLALLWSVFGRIDIVALGQGKVVPGERVKTIQPLETASVRRILVRDGQAVWAGQVLIELDATSVSADAVRMQGDQQGATLQVMRAQALLKALQPMAAGALPSAPVFVSAPGIEPERAQEANRFLQAQYNEFMSRLVRIDSDLTRREAELKTAQAMVRKLELTLPIARQRAQDYQRLVAEQFVSQHGFLEREQARIEMEADLVGQRSRVQEVQAMLQETRQQRASLRAEFERTALDALEQARRQQASLQQETIKAGTRVEAMTLKSPVDGVVQQLGVHTVGGIVTPAQALMVVVPQGDWMEVEAFLPNKDVGFVQVGQIASVKVETFEFTKFGALPGAVVSISTDAIADEKLGLVYAMRVRLDRASLQVEGRTAGLGPGMAVSVEIKTGRRRVIEYFLSPLLRHTGESLRER